MTGKLINLRRERKRRDRDARAEKAEVASIQHGVAKQDREIAKLHSEQADRDLDGKKRD